MCDKHPGYPGIGIRLCPDCKSLEQEFGGDLGAVAKHLEHRAAITSPAERALWMEYLRSPDVLRAFDLQPQHPAGRYRIDFADPGKHLAIEVDGLAYHNGQESSFMKDQQRQRDLMAQGWRVVRFAAKQVMDDPRWCLGEIARVAS
jgi:very-short-patch-repair endonuclease